MIPLLSSVTVQSEWMEPVGRRTKPLIAFALGGRSIGSAESLDYNVLWTMQYEGEDMVLSSEGTEPVVALSRPGVTMLNFCFDQSLQPHIAYEANGKSYFWHFDTTSGSWKDMEVNGISPFVQLDDKRLIQRSQSDVILSYIRDNKLYVRVQRERYEVEHDFGPAPGRITALALNTAYRLQWRIKETMQ